MGVLVYEEGAGRRVGKGLKKTILWIAFSSPVPLLLTWHGSVCRNLSTLWLFI